MSEEVSRSIADVLAENAALQSQLGQAHEATLLAQADAETVQQALDTLDIAWHEAKTDRAFRRAYVAMRNQLARTAHPGAALADEVARARAEIAFLRSWLRGELTISDAEIDAMRAEIAETEAAFDAALAKAGQK